MLQQDLVRFTESPTIVWAWSLRLKRVHETIPRGSLGRLSDVRGEEALSTNFSREIMLPSGEANAVGAYKCAIEVATGE